MAKHVWRLEDKSAAGGVADFIQVGVAGELDHWWRPTHQDECVIAGRGQVLSHHVLTDEALTVLPAWNTVTYSLMVQPREDADTCWWNRIDSLRHKASVFIIMREWSCGQNSPSGALSTVNHSLKRSGWFTWISSSSSRSRMSFSVWEETKDPVFHPNIHTTEIKWFFFLHKLILDTVCSRGAHLVGKQQVTHCSVLRILHHCSDELQHGCDPWNNTCKEWSVWSALTFLVLLYKLSICE